MSKTKKKKKHRLFWHFFRIQLVLLVLVLTAAAYYFYGGYGKQVEELKQEAVRLVRQSDVDTFKANQTSIVCIGWKRDLHPERGKRFLLRFH